MIRFKALVIVFVKFYEKDNPLKPSGLTSAVKLINVK
jgi:hypothetical protein